MKKIITTTILVLSIIVTVNAQSNEVLAKSYFLKAQEAYSNGENTTALEQLDKTVEYLSTTNAKIEALYVKISLNNNNSLEADKHLKNYFKNANEDHSDYNEMVSLSVEIKEKAEGEKEKERQRILDEKKIIREALKNKKPIPITIVESPPIYPGCEGGRNKLKDCFEKK
ncbi:hypothetical protein [Tenacibaculum insulae]|uniref:hypothetical protein n=1 Tax=Tenacibaculum insulae TaxID=2029677 RepID=UPI003AB31458